MDILKELKNRKSHSVFKKKDIEKEKIDLLIEAARWSPSCFNNQPWNYIFVSKKHDTRKQVENALSGSNYWAKKSPYLVIVFSMKNSDCETENRPYYAYDSGMSVMSMAVEAEHQGLNIHQMAGYNGDKIRRALSIPEKYQVLVVFALGYPEKPENIWDKLTENLKQKIAQSRTRKNKDKNFFFGKYQNVW
jgi:nitroreductase